jgi:hypothetical protein
VAQVFPRWANILPILIAKGLAVGPVFAVAAVWYFGSPEWTDVGYQPVQPVAYSHKLHAGDLGIDCRYCHTSVDHSQEANIPPTSTCMNCHNNVRTDSEKLALVRESAKSGKPIEWVRIHKVGEYAYFDHSVHVNAGVGCASCHGRVDKMEIVEQAEPLSMGWCLKCHRNPEPHLRPLDKVTDMDWKPPANQASLAKDFIKERKLHPPEDCSACHR